MKVVHAYNAIQMVKTRKFILLIFCISFVLFAFGQNNEEIKSGEVTFITSKNVYVKFENTDNVKIGDTLKINKTTPCLLVTNKSSSSVVCTITNDCVVDKGTEVYHIFKESKVVVIEEEEVLEDIGISYNDSIKAVNEISRKKNYDEDIRARLSASSYSTLSSDREDNHRILTRFSLNANHINYSKFSIETYLNYRKTISASESSSINANALRVFNFAVKYDMDSTLSFTIGRKINYKASSLGAIDGLQVEKFFGNSYLGVIAGFRPDIFDFGFNSNLLQYGAYLGQLTESENFRSQTTLGFAEQKNNNEIDRRFTYFQHSSTISKNLNLFATAELDIYSKLNDSTSNNNPRLTNLYVSGRYRFNRDINATVSYDSRKRIIYYKTYETEIEELLDEDIARQGIRARLNINPFKYLYSGFSYSKRFQSDNQNKSDNIYGYISYSKLPTIGGRISLTYNMNSSNYLDSDIASLRYSRTFFDDRLSADFYYRFVNYKYTSTVPDFSQNYFGTYLSYYLDRSLVISLSGEYSTYNIEDNFRINTRIIKRFYRKRKK
jgi:hypothetical protein